MSNSPEAATSHDETTAIPGGVDHGAKSGAAIAHIGEIIDLLSAPAPSFSEQMLTLLRTPQFEVMQVLVPQGSSLPAHRPEGDVIIHCVYGGIAVTALDKVCELHAGQLLYLPAASRFSLRGLDDASILVTTVAPKDGANVELIGQHDPD